MYQATNVGIFKPLSLIHADPNLYGFLGCTCLAGYDAVVSSDMPGKQLLPGQPFAVGLSALHDDAMPLIPSVRITMAEHLRDASPNGSVSSLYLVQRTLNLPKACIIISCWPHHQSFMDRCSSALLRPSSKMRSSKIGLLTWLTFQHLLEHKDLSNLVCYLEKR